MSQFNESQHQPFQASAFVKPMLIGAGFALLIISFFVFGVDDARPEWGPLWRIRPLLVTPLAGAVGGAFYAFMDYLSNRGFNRVLAVMLSIAVYFVGLWLGIVLGLDGTMWD